MVSIWKEVMYFFFLGCIWVDFMNFLYKNYKLYNKSIMDFFYERAQFGSRLEIYMVLYFYMVPLMIWFVVSLPKMMDYTILFYLNKLFVFHFIMFSSSFFFWGGKGSFFFCFIHQVREFILVFLLFNLFWFFFKVKTFMEVLLEVHLFMYFYWVLYLDYYYEEYSNAFWCVWLCFFFLMILLSYFL